MRLGGESSRRVGGGGARLVALVGSAPLAAEHTLQLFAVQLHRVRHFGQSALKLGYTGGARARRLGVGLSGAQRHGRGLVARALRCIASARLLRTTENKRTKTHELHCI